MSHHQCPAKVGPAGCEFGVDRNGVTKRSDGFFELTLLREQHTSIARCAEQRRVSGKCSVIGRDGLHVSPVVASA